MRKFSIFILGMLVVSGITVIGQESSPENDAHFRQLRHEAMDVRITALRELHTTLDPRLPEALLVLLKDEGNSIRRLATRGIGSRYWQIPEERIPVFVRALRANANSEFETEKSMASRAIALLNRSYDSPETSRSPNGRWVIYERYGLPCLIDTSTGTEELLGWNPDDRISISSYLFRESDERPSIWHPDKERLAMSASVSRRESTMIAWVHREGFARLDHGKVFTALDADEERVNSAAGFYIDYSGWEGDQVRVDCQFLLIEFLDEGLPQQRITESEIEARLLWDPVSGQVTKVSKKVDR